ncbi:S8 family peptidase [Luteimonas salinilitoris]|uniref:S8 family peptidase n=1 Tax=Luteimonas salinilitoris TaxID=3237697 RepID=A0ABV4HNI7_9GAMM
MRIRALSAMVMTVMGTASVHAAHAGDLDVVGPPAAQADGARLHRLIVKYRDGSAERRDVPAKLRAIESAAARALPQRTVRAQAGLQPRHVRTLAIGADVIRLAHALDRAEGEALMREIAADPAVVYVEADLRLRHTGVVAPALVPDDQYYDQYQWHLKDNDGGIRAPSAWDVSAGAGVVVAVLDTGITAHPDLDDNVLEGYDFITDSFVSRRETDERVPGAQDHGDWNPEAGECYAGSPAQPSSWHGTHVAGTVAELGNNGIGMAGVAFDAKVLPVRVLGRCGGYTSDIADAVVWASGGSVDGVPDNENPAEVINMSLGGGGSCGAAMQSAIDGAVARGTTVVVAAGNSAADAADFYPASCGSVIVVGANRINGGIAGYSNYGGTVDLSAPGGGGGVDGNPGGYVWQSWNDGETSPGEPAYVGMTGTSMAAPHVAGVAALVQSAAETPLAPQALEQLLRDSARPFPVVIPTGTPIGAGIVDAAAALEAALAEPCDPEVEECGPEAMPLVNRVPVNGLIGGGGAQLLFSIDVPAGTRSLNLRSYGGSGDVSLYVAHGRAPTVQVHDRASTRPGNSEAVVITNPAEGSYYLLVVGDYAFTNLSVLGLFQ